MFPDLAATKVSSPEGIAQDSHHSERYALSLLSPESAPGRRQLLLRPPARLLHCERLVPPHARRWCDRSGPGARLALRSTAHSPPTSPPCLRRARTPSRRSSRANNVHKQSRMGPSAPGWLAIHHSPRVKTSRERPVPL